MALDQRALLELLGELKLTDVTDRIRVATETLYQELIDAEAAAFIGAAPFERTPDRADATQRHPSRTLTTTAGEFLDQANPDMGEEAIAYRQIPLWLSPTELQVLIDHIQSASPARTSSRLLGQHTSLSLALVPLTAHLLAQPGGEYADDDLPVEELGGRGASSSSWSGSSVPMDGRSTVNAVRLGPQPRSPRFGRPPKLSVRHCLCVDQVAHVLGIQVEVAHLRAIVVGSSAGSSAAHSSTNGSARGRRAAPNPCLRSPAHGDCPAVVQCTGVRRHESTRATTRRRPRCAAPNDRGAAIASGDVSGAQSAQHANHQPFSPGTGVNVTMSVAVFGCRSSGS